jgi:MATE family multidrug resistance protein
MAGITFTTATLLLRSTVGSSITFVSRAYGAGDEELAGRFLGNFVFLALILSPLAFLMPAFFKLYFLLINPDPAITSLARTFLNVRIFDLPFSLANAALFGFLAGIGNTRLTMLFSWIGVSINIAANWILVFGKFGLPALGVAGSALGTVIAVIIQTIVSFIVTWFIYKDRFKLQLFRIPDSRLLRRMLRIGGPMGIMDFIEVAAWSTFLALISKLGTVELASSQIALQVSGLAFMPGLAMGAATCSLVSRFIGASDIKAAEKSGYSGAVLGVSFMGAVGLIFVSFPVFIAKLFSSDVNVLPMTVLLLKLLAIYQIFDAMNIVFRGALNGAGDTRFTMSAVCIGSWLILVPVVYVSTFLLHWGIAGSWAAAIIYLVLLGLTVAFRFKSGRWKSMSI